MNSMNSEWDSTLVQNSDVADMSKFFSFDDFDQDQDISKDLDRLFAEPGDAIESENITPTGPQHLNHSASNAHTNASCSLKQAVFATQSKFQPPKYSRAAGAFPTSSPSQWGNPSTKPTSK